jgi:hypothetical protein
MALGLGLAFPGGIGARSGSGPRVAPILVTPARSQATVAGRTPAAPAATGSSVAVTSSSPPTRGTTPRTAPRPTPTTPPTVAPDVVNTVNQTVSDVLGNLPPGVGGASH